MPRRLRAAALGLLAGLGVLLAGGAVSADPRPLTVDDILRLHAAGVDEDIIISEIVVTDTVFLLSVDEILRLQEAGLSDRLLQFLVDTGRDDHADDAGAEAIPEDAEDDADDGEAEVAYVEETVTRPVYVSLRWSYPVWWYDYYWYDYWYYDCHYDPWLVSWTVPCGVWYPTWYWGSRCWAPPGWGYRYHWWTSCGYGYDRDHGYTSYWDRWGSGAHDLSQRKYKSGGSSAGKLAVAGVGLKTREGTRLPEDRSVRVASRKGRLAMDSGDLDVRRPARSGSKPVADRGDAVRRPVKSTVRTDADRPDVRRPARPVRNPAPADRPVKHVVRRSGEKPAPSDRTPRAPAAAKPAPPARGDTKVRPPVAPRPEPAPQPAPPPRVESRPAPKAAPAPAAPSGGGKDRGNPGSGSGKTRGR